MECRQFVQLMDSGMLTFTDDELKQQIQEDVGVKPHFPMESFSGLGEVETGRLREVS